MRERIHKRLSPEFIVDFFWDLSWQSRNFKIVLSYLLLRTAAIMDF